MHILSSAFGNGNEARLEDELKPASPFSFEQAEKLPYLTGVLKNTLRLNIGIALPTPRVAVNPTMIDGIFIPAGMNFILPPSPRWLPDLKTIVGVSTKFVLRNLVMLPQHDELIRTLNAIKLDKHLVVFSTQKLDVSSVVRDIPHLVRKFDIKLFEKSYLGGDVVYTALGSFRMLATPNGSIRKATPFTSGREVQGAFSGRLSCVQKKRTRMVQMTTFIVGGQDTRSRATQMFRRFCEFMFASQNGEPLINADYDASQKFYKGEISFTQFSKTASFLSGLRDFLDGDEGFRGCMRGLVDAHPRPHNLVEKGDPASFWIVTSRQTMELKEQGPSTFRQFLEHVAQLREQAGEESRELGVAFENLHVTGVGTPVSYQPTFTSQFNPSATMEAAQMAKHSKPRVILSEFEGTVTPGEMLLVLGRPGSGCTTFLKTLSNRRQEFSVDGDVYFDSLTPTDINDRYRGDVVFCAEDDIHFPTLTVEQTIRFAAKLRAPHQRLGYSKEEYVYAVCNSLLTVLGLERVKNTLVGDAAVRGVSGGERKRVSIAEVLALHSRITAWDNPTRGLDSSTALEIIETLRMVTDVTKGTTVVSLYQAGESLYNLFDKVCVVYDGRMAYYGPAATARAYFIEMGYQPANRQTTSDFLVAVTDPLGRFPRPDMSNIPRTAEEFAAYFQKSGIASANKENIRVFKNERTGDPARAQKYIDNARMDHSKHTLRDSSFLVSLPMQTRAVMLRRVQMLKGNMLATALNLSSYAIQGVIVGTLYLKLGVDTDSFFSRGGILFYALFFQALLSMAEIPSLFAQRPIVLRQTSWALYRPFVDQIALTLVDLPIAFTCCVTFAVLLYFIAQLQQTPAQFFIFLLFMFLESMVARTWFRATAAALPDETTAQTVAGLTVLTYSLYTGYALPKPSMVGAMKWIAYLNPLQWGLEAILSNEFRTIMGRCVNLVPQGPGYENVTLENQVCTTVGSQPGETFVNGPRFVSIVFDYTYSHTWRNLGIVLAFGLAFLIALIFLTEFNTRVSAKMSLVLFKRGAGPKPALAPNGRTDVEMVSVRHGHDGDKTPPSHENLDVIESTGIFTWQHLTYTIQTSSGEKRLLSDVAGHVTPGKLTALMGETGAGKTTLLNVLAQRVNVGVVTGDRFINGKTLPNDFQSQTAYCQQEDTHEGSSTVKEALLFSARLRQPTSVPLSEKEAYVDKCIELCGLGHFSHATIGSLSTENRKRTTIAVELAAKPKLLLFLDEPTSGLDSQSAWKIVQLLRDLANAGQAILCTIHQPSAELFQRFDRLLLLRKGGETVYCGDLGHNASTILDYFHGNGARVSGHDENPAEYMLDIIGAGSTAVATEDWHAIWQRSPECAKLNEEIHTIHSKTYDDLSKRDAQQVTEYATGWFNQVAQLVKRDFSAHNRDPDYIMAKVMLNVVTGLYIGLSYFRSDDTQQGTQNKLFAVFMASVIGVPLATQLQIPFLNMRKIYEIRERPSRMYNWTALVASQLIVEIPFNIGGSSLFFFCWYWTVGFPSDRAGYSYLMIAVLFPLWYTTIGQCTAAMSPNAEIAAIVYSFLTSFVISFNGVVQPYRQLGWWKWMYRMSPFTYLIEGFIGQAIGEQLITCSSTEFVSLEPPAGQTCGEFLSSYISLAGGYLSNPTASSACSFCSTRTTGEYLDNAFSIFYHQRWRDAGVLLGFVGFNIICTFLFTWLTRIRK